MKKTYLNPTMVVVKLQHQTHLMDESTAAIQSLSTNLGDDAIGFGGAGSGSARTKESNGIWDEEW